MSDEYWKNQYEELKAQVDAANQARWRKEDSKREERAKLYAEQAEAEAHTAESWEEAFRKGIRLMMREAREEDIDNQERRAGGFSTTDVDHFFNRRVEQWRAAQAILSEELNAVAPEISALRKQIYVLEQRARSMAADRVEKLEEQSLADALRKDDYSYLVEW